ncbi:MAG: hypothetical protein ACOY45_12145 [Pseudomonadota bacterium]
MKKIVATMLTAALVAGASMAVAQDKTSRTDKGKLTLFEGNNFDLKEYEVKGARPSISLEFNISSIAVYPGEKWQVCGNLRYKDPCFEVTEDMTGLGGIAVRSARQIKE